MQMQLKALCVAYTPLKDCQLLHKCGTCYVIGNQPYTLLMASSSHYTHISIRCGGLIIELGTEAEYPDMVDDLANRALNAFKETLLHAKENGVDITDMRLITTDYGDDEEEED